MTWCGRKGHTSAQEGRLEPAPGQKGLGEFRCHGNASQLNNADLDHISAIDDPLTSARNIASLVESYANAPAR